MENGIIEEIVRLRRLAGMRLQTRGLKEGRQRLICRCWRADKGCSSCRRAAIPAPNGNGSARRDLDARLRDYRAAEAKG